MNHNLAELIVDNSNGDFSVYENYSGRSMYGNTTTGVVYTNNGELMAAIGLICDEDLDNYKLSREKIMKECCKFRFDNMGKDYIVY